METYLYDSRNRLLERLEGTKKVRYAYDAAGNLTQEQYSRAKAEGQTERTEEIRYAYDTFGRTTEVSGSTFQQKNRYDAEGFRYELEENEKVSRFVYHRGIMLAELDETNQVTGSQYFGNGYIGGKLSKQAGEDSRNSQSDKTGSISKETGKGFSSGSDVDFIFKERELCYYIRDEQGSVRYVVDQSGNVVNEYQYSAFGETERAEERYENRLCYNGQMYDGLTEQYYLRSRYYQPKIGRFTQEDLLYEDGLNLYAYCKGNPVMYCDPSGLAGIPLSDTACKTKVKAEGDGGATTGDNSKILSNNLAREGRPVGEGQAAAHIVASTGSKRQWESAADSRKLLNKYDIDINDAANGISLGHPRPHNLTHNRAFHEKVNYQLHSVEINMQNSGYGRRAIRSALRNELRKIGKEFENGTRN